MTQYAMAHPWLTFWLVLAALWVAGLAIVSVVAFLQFCINRPLRHWTIRKHGYPPPHCDADGDFRDAESEGAERD